MILSGDKLYFGVAPKILLDCARQLHYTERAFTFDDFCQALGAPAGECRPVFQEMLAAGYFDRSATGEYVPTKLFKQLALASIGTGLARVEADRLLTRVIAQAQRINASQQTYKCKVLRLAVFGSYLSSKSVLGDLDLAAEVQEERPTTTEEAHARTIAFFRGRVSLEGRVYAALRLRKPKQISLHTFEELERLKTPYEIVFESE